MIMLSITDFPRSGSLINELLRALRELLLILNILMRNTVVRFIAASQTSNFFSDKLQFTTSYIREGDDENSPRNLTLSDSEKRYLPMQAPIRFNAANQASFLSVVIHLDEQGGIMQDFDT